MVFLQPWLFLNDVTFFDQFFNHLMCKNAWCVSLFHLANYSLLYRDWKSHGVLKVWSKESGLVSDFSSRHTKNAQPRAQSLRTGFRIAECPPVAKSELLEYNHRVLIINQQLGQRENSELWPQDNHKPLHNCPSWMDGELPFPADAHLCALLDRLFRPLSPVMATRPVSAADAPAAWRP